MTKIIADEMLRSSLHNFSQALELCDESGRVLGRFFPALDLSEYEPCESPTSEAELRRRQQSSERRYTTAEVLAYLEKL
jgi:hypothetical protein